MFQWLQNLFASSEDDIPTNRRRWLKGMLVSTGAMAVGVQQANAHQVELEDGEEKEERFPGDPPEHFLAYPFNHSDDEYHNHVLGSVGAMIGKYEDNVDQVVVCFGSGIHILAKKPVRAVAEQVKEKVKSLAGQGVKFHACNRTLTSMNWGQDDLYDFVTIVDVGAADIMELQERNYALMVW